MDRRTSGQVEDVPRAVQLNPRKKETTETSNPLIHFAVGLPYSQPQSRGSFAGQRTLPDTTVCQKRSDSGSGGRKKGLGSLPAIFAKLGRGRSPGLRSGQD